MKNKRTLFITSIVTVLLLSVTFSSGQTLKEAVEGLSNEVGLAYASSVINPFAANLNSAWINRVPAPEKLGFSISFGIYGMVSPIESGDDTFTKSGSFYLTREQATQIVSDEISDVEIRSQIIDELITKQFNLTINGSSITSNINSNIIISTDVEGGLRFKIKDSKIPFPVYVELDATETYEIDIENYLNAFSYLPYGAAQLNLGTIYGTEAMIRFIPAVEVDTEIGSVGMYGLGLLHNPQAYISTELPVELSVGLMYQNFYTDNNGDISAFSAGLNVRKSFELGWLTIAPFANFMFESASFDLKEERSFETNYGTETFEISLSTEGANSSRFGLGTMFRVGFVDLTFSYNFAKYNSMVGGISFNFDTFD